MTSPGFAGSLKGMSGYTFTPLSRATDESRLQDLLDRCSDHYLLHEGWPTPKDAAEQELVAVPEGRSVADLQVIGMATPDGELVAAVQLLRNCPGNGDWWIGMLVVTPSLRSHGLGAQLFEHVLQLVRAEGGHALHLVVSLKNPRAQKFWERLGFVDTQRLSRVVARNGHVDEVRILSQELNRG